MASKNMKKNQNPLFLVNKWISIEETKKIPVYLIVVTVLSIVSSVVKPPETYFSQKSNVFNQVFAKYAWAWNLAFLLPAILIVVSSTKRKHIVSLHLTRILTATIFWWICTNAFNLILTWYGNCESENYSSRRDCVKSGNTWYGFDISGHCFIEIFGSLVLTSEVQILKKLKKKYAEQIGHYKNAKFLVETLIIAMAFLQILWEILLICTVIYFHTVTEKILGSLCAVFIWWLIYKHLMKYSQILHKFLIAFI